jgi:broad specificity phosphatase PhoE
MIPVALIRHGPTSWNEEKRLQGRSDVPLSPAGEAKVAGWRLPDEFHGFRWVASPLTRARQTAAALGLAPETEHAVIEMDWGAWEGHTFDELTAIYGDEVRRRADMGLDLRPHGGESPRDVRVRVRAWLDQVAEAGHPVGAVAHQGIVRAALSLATGWEMVGKPPAKMDWSSVHLFALEDDGSVRIERLNISLEAEPAAE